MNSLPGQATMRTEHLTSVSRVSCFLVGLLALMSTACFLSVKPVYSDNELAVAERAVTEFHRFHNDKNFAAIYKLMYYGSKNEPETKTLETMGETFRTVGKVLNTKRMEGKVLPISVPGFSSQVRFSFDTTFERGEWTELFVWNIKGSSEAQLAEYRIIPKTDQKTDSSK